MRFAQRPCKSLITGKCANEPHDRNFDIKDSTQISFASERDVVKLFQLGRDCIKGESNPRRVDGNDPGYHYPINAIPEQWYDIICNRPDAWLRNRRDFKAEGGPISTPYLY